MNSHIASLNSLVKDLLSRQSASDIVDAEAIFVIKKRILTATLAERESVADNLCAPGVTGAKELFNVVLERIFPDLRTRTIDNQTALLERTERLILEHFKSYSIVAASTGSFSILRTARSKFSDYDCFVVSDSQGHILSDAIQELEQSFAVYRGEAEGAIDEATMVVENGNSGYGLVHAISKEGVFLDFFVLGANSLGDLAKLDGRVKKLKPSNTVELCSRSIIYPHEPKLTKIVSMEDPYIQSWPKNSSNTERAERVIGFLTSAFLYTSPSYRSLPNSSFEEMRLATFHTARSLIVEYNPGRYFSNELSEQRLQKIMNFGAEAQGAASQPG